MVKRKNENDDDVDVEVYLDRTGMLVDGMKVNMLEVSGHTEASKPVFEWNDNRDVVSVDLAYDETRSHMPRYVSDPKTNLVTTILFTENRKGFHLKDAVSEKECRDCLTKLQSMSLFKCNGRFPSYIQHCIELTSLTLDSCSWLNLSLCVDGMNHLARVSMVDCKGTSLSALSVLTGLKHFSYERNEIEDMNDMILRSWKMQEEQKRKKQNAIRRFRIERSASQELATRYNKIEHELAEYKCEQNGWVER